MLTIHDYMKTDILQGEKNARGCNIIICLTVVVTQSFPDNGTNSSQTMWKNELHDNDKIKFEWYFKTIHIFYVKFSHVKYYF
jgi:hypothetical protein